MRLVEAKRTPFSWDLYDELGDLAYTVGQVDGLTLLVRELVGERGRTERASSMQEIADIVCRWNGWNTEERDRITGMLKVAS